MLSSHRCRTSHVALWLSLAAASASAELHFVDRIASGNGDGSSWLDAFTDLQSALAAADSSDAIWVARGVYRPSDSGDRDATFLLPNGVEIYGGFAGGESLVSQRDLLLNPTELNGDIGIVGDEFDNSYHIVTTSDCDSTCLLDGFTITQGLADGAQDRGAGILNIGGAPRIANVTLFQNLAANRGGGVYSLGGAPRFTRVSFIDNWSTTGAGCYNEAGNPRFVEVQFDQNEASVRGGGLYDKAGGSHLANVQFSLNGAFDGAAVYCDSAATNFENVDFVLNGADCFGGALFSRKSDPTLRDVRFENNFATFSGGGMYVQGGTPSLTDVVFRANSCAGQAEDGGGGMFNADTNPLLVNVVFDRNSHIYYGGGMANVGASPQLVNVSFSGNRAAGATGGRGGAISNRAGSNPTLNNVVCWGDSAAVAGEEIYNEASSPELAHCIVEASGGSGASWNPAVGTDGGQNLDFDPLFIDAASGNLRFAIGSPAMNRGDSASVPPSVDTDLDGNLRIVGASVDIGAYELVDALEITQIADIPNDQGRFVRLSIAASSLDVFGSALPIVQYESYRRIDTAEKSSIRSLAERAANARARGMISSAKILAEGWDYLGSIPAHASASYNVVVPTLGDSTASAIYWSTFFVRAATAQPTVYFDSPADSGYSIDNLAPAMPLNLGVAYVWAGAGNELDWDALLEPDLSHFRVYRGATADFLALPETHVAVTTNTSWLDPQAQGTLVYYKVSAVDFAGNESAPASPLQVTATPALPKQPVLLPNFPNPGPSQTALRFALPTAASFRMTVYDSAGRRVWLHEGRGDAGENALLWDGRDSGGQVVASGSYYAQLRVGTQSMTRKLLLLR